MNTPKAFACRIVGSGLLIVLAARASFAAQPGVAKVSKTANQISLGNEAMNATWTIDGQQLVLTRFTDRINGRDYLWQVPAFTLQLGNGSLLASDHLVQAGAVWIRALTEDPAATTFSERLPGKMVEVRYEVPQCHLKIAWRAILRDGSPYVRQQVILTPESADVVIGKLTLLSPELVCAKVCGQVRGSPIVTDTLFLSVEDPLAVAALADAPGQTARAECSYSRGVPLPVGEPFVVSSVVGCVPQGQLRREFNAYLERERAHPYRQFLHYNSWYHLNIERPDNRMTEAEAIQAVHDIGTELTVKRGVTLQSYVMDDGWDSHVKVWDFHEGFPQGFTGLAKEAAKYGGGIGLWMSPWGGYGKVKQTRLIHGREAGFETNKNGFSMAGNSYRTHFLNTGLRMVRQYRANFFKFDGMGGGNSTDGADTAYANDMDAILNVVIRGLRQANPDLYISATVGTWPSPFWLRHADSIWRQGADIGQAGLGDGRQRWITYRDGTAYARICQRGPLYPLSALMFHGLAIGDRDWPAKLDLNERSVRHEIRTLFGSGTSLLELYISPHLLTPTMWDDLAESAKWARRNQDCLVDSHWVGGDPIKGEIYGFASWTADRGTITLRNPADRPQDFRLDLVEALELPSDARTPHQLHSPYKDQRISTLRLDPGRPQTIAMEPFEVLVFDVQPLTHP